MIPNSLMLADAEFQDAIMALNRAASYLSMTQGKSIVLRAVASVQLARGLIGATNYPSEEDEHAVAIIEENVSCYTQPALCSEQPDLF